MGKMTSDQPVRPGRHVRLWVALVFACILIALLVVPPLVSIARYKTRVTQLVSVALHRPVRLSSVELRLLPRPAFLLTDLTVEEDPAYGPEPVLHANTVTAAMRLSSLWRGQLQISRISVDEASVNLVRTADGRWNVDALFQTAATQAARRSSVPLPYLEATNSRINVKSGLEKLPYSLVNTDATLWHDGGAWRLRLRAQPARTDVSLDMGDTGIVRAEVTLHPAPRREQMPLHIDLDWRQAQLGQLSRLLLGSDEGWRGDLTGELHLDGTPEIAQIKSRLRASGVHRAEFATASPLDFDANCSLVYRGMQGALEKLICESPVGDGRARLTGSIPGNGQSPNLTFELDRVPAQVGIDALRSVRSNVDPAVQATGAVSGRISYMRADAQPPVPQSNHRYNAKPGNTPALPQPLSGSFIVENLRISGGSLSAPIAIARMELAPAPPVEGQMPALSTTVNIPAGEPSPVVVSTRLGQAGFVVSLHGPATLQRTRDLAQFAGLPVSAALDKVTGDPVMLDFTVEDRWLSNVAPPPGAAPPVFSAGPPSQHLSGAVSFHAASWKPDFLAKAILISGATLYLEDSGPRWENVAFAYGTVKGTGSLRVPLNCEPEDAGCIPEFSAHFTSLDTAAVESAILGATEPGTLLSELLAKLKSSPIPAWPRAKGTIQADALTAGKFTLNQVTAQVNVLAEGAEITSGEANLLGGTAHGSATLDVSAKPAYRVRGTFTKVNPQQAGQLCGMRSSGGQIDGSADLTLAGYSDQDMVSSARGTISFEWRNGAMTSLPGQPVPAGLSRFDRWAGDVKIADGSLNLEQSELDRSGRTSNVQARAPLALPAKLTFEMAKPAGKRR